MNNFDPKSLADGTEWNASVLLTRYKVDGVTHTSAEVRIVNAPSLADALEGAKEIMDALAADRRTFIRNPPEGDSFRDFADGIERHRGYARFTFIDEPGERTIIEQEAAVGLAYLSLGGESQ